MGAGVAKAETQNSPGRHNGGIPYGSRLRGRGKIVPHLADVYGVAETVPLA